MKKRLALTLLLAVALGLVPTAAQESVTPTPPAWCPEEEYAVFPGSAAYEPENWELIQETRREVSWGAINIGSLPRRREFFRMSEKTNDDFGVLLEQALVEVRLLYTHDDYNGPYWPYLMYVLDGGDDPDLDGLTDQQRYAVLLWTARGILRYKGVGERLDEYLPYLMEFPQFSLSKLTDNMLFTDEQRAQLNAELQQRWAEYTEGPITLWLDGVELTLDVPPEVKNQRTMVPIRAVVEAIGGDVAWDQETRQVTMTRAGSTVTMTLDSITATVDGKTVEMDVAPYATNGRTLIPARYAAEFFGQKVDWNGARRQVLITEDKSVAGDSNLETWALDLGMVYGVMAFGANYGLPEPYGKPIIFGIYNRGASQAQSMRASLAETWGVGSREDLIELVQRMTPHGHNDSFQEAAAIVNGLSGTQLDQLIARSSGPDKYMWPYTKEISQRWGDRGILAWDLSRMGAMVQWGYLAGYITYEEALELIEPAARLAQANFADWDEFYLNYLDGYNWWARNDVYTAQKEYKEQVNQIYENDPYDREPPDSFEYWAGFPRAEDYQYAVKRVDDSLFEAGVIPLPGEA